VDLYTQMRTRTRNVVLDSMILSNTTFTGPYQWCNGATPSSPVFSIAPSNTPTEWLNEAITDSLGRGKVNKVTHYKHHVKLTPKVSTLVYHDPGGTPANVSQGPIPNPMTYLTAHKNAHQGWSLNSSMPSGFTTDYSNLDDGKMVNDLLENARQLKADVLLNLVEANQVWPSISSLATSLPKMGANWRDLRKVISTASGAFLAWKFGVSPILSDVMNIQRYLPKLEQDVIRHGKQQASRFSITAEFPCAYAGPVGTSNPRIETAGRVLQAPIVRYVLVVKPKTKYHTSFFKKVDLVLSRFASSPASLAWEKIPFSFVVDWFVDLRGSLTKLDSLLGSEPYEVIGFSRSFSFHLQNELQFVNQNGCTGGDLWTSPQAQSVYKYYERIPVSDVNSIPVWRPRFGKSQAGITAALISQQLSKLH
jgi:hypothetical protein